MERRRKKKDGLEASRSGLVIGSSLPLWSGSRVRGLGRPPIKAEPITELLLGPYGRLTFLPLPPSALTRARKDVRRRRRIQDEVWRRREREKRRQAEEGLKGPRTLTACLHFSFLSLDFDFVFVSVSSSSSSSSLGVARARRRSRAQTSVNQS